MILISRIHTESKSGMTDVKEIFCLKVSVLLKLVYSYWIQCSSPICTKWGRANFASFKFCCKLLIYLSMSESKKVLYQKCTLIWYYMDKFCPWICIFMFVYKTRIWFTIYNQVKQRHKVKLLAWYEKTLSNFILGPIKHA